MFVLREAFKVFDYFFGKPEQAHFSTEATVKERLLQIKMKNCFSENFAQGLLEFSVTECSS